MTTLCRACGLCCDGSLFNFVALGDHEISARKTLRVIRDGKGFEQPCSALVERSCAIYEERPAACRAFVCKLYEDNRALEPKLAIVARTRELLASRTHTDELDMLMRHFDRAV